MLERARQARSIVIKPNLTAGSAFSGEDGVVTSTSFAAQIVDLLHQLNPAAQIWIAESDSKNHHRAEAKFAHLGYYQLVETRPFLSLLNLSQDARQGVPGKKLGYFSGLYLSRQLLNSDLLISLAKIKTHNLCQVTGAVKNLFGCLSESNKYLHHPAINRALADLLTVIPPTLSIVDGNPAMEGNGPVFGKPRPIQTVLIGNNPVAVDAVMCRRMGIDPGEVAHLQYASGQGHGPLQPGQIELRGIGWEEVAVSPAFQPVDKRKRLLVSSGQSLVKAGNALSAVGWRVTDLSSPQELITVLVRKFRRLLKKH